MHSAWFACMGGESSASQTFGMVKQLHVPASAHADVSRRRVDVGAVPDKGSYGVEAARARGQVQSGAPARAQRDVVAEVVVLPGPPSHVCRVALALMGRCAPEGRGEEIGKRRLARAGLAVGVPEASQSVDAIALSGPQHGWQAWDDGRRRERGRESLLHDLSAVGLEGCGIGVADEERVKLFAGAGCRDDVSDSEIGDGIPDGEDHLVGEQRKAERVGM